MVDAINGEILAGDNVVAEVRNGAVTVINSSLAPLFFKRCCGVEDWLKSRAIDAHRTHSRLLKKALRLSARDDVSTVLAVHAVTITDRYWFRKDGENLSWDDVRFKENLFADLALKGDPNAFTLEPSKTPELTNTGSFEKCWKRIDAAWWLYKDGSESEKFSELFVCELGKRLAFPMAQYEYADGYVRSKDYTNDASVNFEPVSSVVGDNEDYSENFNLMLTVSDDVAKDYLKMIYLDTLCHNMDRHTGNYGFLRDVQTGNIISLAPNYDNNLSLIARGCPDVARDKDGLIRLFSEFLQSNEKAATMMHGLRIPNISERMIEDSLNVIPIKTDERYIKDFILNGQQRMQDIIMSAVKYKPLDDLIAEVSCDAKVYHKTIMNCDIEK